MNNCIYNFGWEVEAKMLLGRLNVDKNMILQDVLERTNRLLSFDKTGTA
jgi:hypothetical protein